MTILNLIVVKIDQLVGREVSPRQFRKSLSDLALAFPLCANSGLMHYSNLSQSRTRRLMVEPRDDRIGHALAILPRSANGAPEGLVDSFAGKPDDIV